MLAPLAQRHHSPVHLGFLSPWQSVAVWLLGRLRHQDSSAVSRSGLQLLNLGCLGPWGCPAPWFLPSNSPAVNQPNHICSSACQPLSCCHHCHSAFAADFSMLSPLPALGEAGKKRADVHTGRTPVRIQDKRIFEMLCRTYSQ